MYSSIIMKEKELMKKEVANEIDFDERFYRAAWQSLSMNGSEQVVKLLKYFSTAKAAWLATDEEVSAAGAFRSDVEQSILAKRRAKLNYPEQLMEKCHEKSISLVGLGETDYPVLLAEIYNPPQILFYRGRLRWDAQRISIVGSRRVTPYGKAMAELLGRTLGEAGIHVVSGGAVGVDTDAHRGALVKGTTEVVLGCGVDIAYPYANRRLYSEILERGAIISEYPPGTRPLPTFFPLRNRIISGMSRGTVVVEAAEHSGSLITAGYAISENRDVFAVPGSVFADTSKGCNKLIQQGAKLITSAEDILLEYADWPRHERSDHKNSGNNMGQEAQRVLAQLTPDVPLTIDEIIFRLQGSIKADSLSCLLLRMELKGLVRKFAGGYIAVP